MGSNERVVFCTKKSMRIDWSFFCVCASPGALQVVASLNQVPEFLFSKFFLPKN